jgi:hypothetical protein
MNGEDLHHVLRVSFLPLEQASGLQYSGTRTTKIQNRRRRRRDDTNAEVKQRHKSETK